MKEQQFSNYTTGPLKVYMSSIRTRLPAVNDLLLHYESTRLCDYIEQLGQHNCTGFQDRQDFIEVFSRYTGEALGPQLAHTVFEELQEMPTVLTANHHGIDTFAQSTQTNLLFSLRKRMDGSLTRTVPVLACGSVPLNNLTYPRGLLIYATTEAFGGDGVCKLPIFPDSFKRKLVSVSGPFTPEMVRRARDRAKKLIEEGKLARPLESAFNLVFDDFDDIGQNFADYSRQATVVNHRFWQRLFRDGACRSDLIYIELEKIASRLIQKDLFDQSTICHQLMFDRELRDRLINNLDGQRGCWQYQQLLNRCSDSESVTHPAISVSAQGTMFFWGIDAKGRQIPLCVIEGQNGRTPELRGVDNRGQIWTNPFTPAGISAGLRDGRLLPSIFTSYLLVSIARGISCIGGYYQADYFPIMQKAVLNALNNRSGDAGNDNNNGKSRTELYLSGMQTVGLLTDRQIRPAGPVEIVASGGLDAEQYEQIGEVTVLQAHIASLYDTIMDTAPDGIDYARANKEIAKLVHDTVGGNLITIPMS